MSTRPYPGAKRPDRSEPAKQVALAAGLVFIPLADQALKLVLRRRVGPALLVPGRVRINQVIAGLLTITVGCGLLLLA
jgi:hypothetical protein